MINVTVGFIIKLAFWNVVIGLFAGFVLGLAVSQP